MMLWRSKCVALLVAICGIAQGGAAEIVVPTHTIRAQTLLTREDLTLKTGEMVGVFSKLEDVLGMEARVALYPGRPLRIGDVGPAAIIERNEIIVLEYDRNGLKISTEGRALMRGAVGERIKVMNLASRNTLMGKVQSGGFVLVSQ